MLDTTHPLWCSPARCEAALDGSHSAEPVAVDFDDHYAAFVRLRLWQHPPYIDDGGIERNPPVLLEMVAGDRDTGDSIRPDLTLGQTRQLSGLLISTLIAAGDDDTQRP